MDRDHRYLAWTIPTAAIALLALIVGLNSLSRSGEGEPSRASQPQAQVLKVDLADIKIEPARFRATAGRRIILDVANEGAMQHNLFVEGTNRRTKMLDAGRGERLDLGPLRTGTYQFACEVPGHKDAGMLATLEVLQEPVAGTASEMDPELMDEEYMRGVKAFPAPTTGLGGQRIEPQIAGGVKVFELTASEVDWEVAPGDVRKAWAFNGTVPGPEIRVRLGDRVRVVLHNKLPETTSLHFHGLELPNDQDGVPGITQDLVKPGGSYTYEFEVTNSGTHMYHPHMNGAKQIPQGLLGAFIVEGPSEPAVAADVPIVLNDGPLGFTLNGKGFPATQPIVARPGQTLRLRYLNEGLQGHPMHLHGMAQTVITRDGYPLASPFKVDTLWVAPGERYDVLVTTRPGVWAFHCHILSHAENEHGMFGMVTAVVVK